MSRRARIIGLAAMLAFSLGLVLGHCSRSDRRPSAPHSATSQLIASLLSEDLDQRRFPFADVASATSGKRVLPLDRSSPAHRRVIGAIDKALAATITRLNQPDSPVRSLRRINEASRHFEDAILAHLDQQPGISCTIPPNRQGDEQRSGYPDLRMVDEATGSVFYLDPKLVEQGSWSSTLRTFYFAPKTGTLKITDDAVHLLAGISHDGNDGAWTFGEWKLVDLSTIQVRLKAEFQASNSDLYPSE